jgi:hypothetical protein
MEQPRASDSEYLVRNDKQNKMLLWLSAINVLLNTLSASAIALISALSDAGLVGSVEAAISTVSSMFT